MPQPVYRAKHRVDGRLRAASGGCSCTDGHAPTPYADADGLVLRCRGLVRGHHRQGLRHRATVSPRHGGRTSASDDQRLATGRLRPASQRIPGPPHRGRRIGRQDSPDVLDGWNSHAGMANKQNGRASKQSDRQTKRTGSQTDRQTGRQTERTDCKYATRRTARILTVPLGVVSDCMYAARSLGRVLTVPVRLRKETLRLRKGTFSA